MGCGCGRAKATIPTVQRTWTRAIFHRRCYCACWLVLSDGRARLTASLAALCNHILLLIEIVAVGLDTSLPLPRSGDCKAGTWAWCIVPQFKTSIIAYRLTSAEESSSLFIIIRYASKKQWWQWWWWWFVVRHLHIQWIKNNGAL